MNEFTSYGPLIESHCPRCNYKLTGATIAHGADQKPEPGDTSICLNCGQVLTYESDLTLRKATASKVRGLMDDAEAWAKIGKAQSFIEKRGRFA